MYRINRISKKYERRKATIDRVERDLKAHELQDLHEAHPIPADHWVPRDGLVK